MGASLQGAKKVKRRDMLLGVAAVGTAACLPGTGARAQSARACYRVHEAQVRCAAGFSETPDIETVACKELSWAACLAYLMRGYGAKMTVERVLDHFGMSADCRPHRDDYMLRGAEGMWHDAAGRRFLVSMHERASLHERYPTGNGFTEALVSLARRPLLCGAAGYTTLITEVTTVEGTMTHLKCERITVRDPWQQASSLRALDPRELRDPFYVLEMTLRPI